jgi:hypothetical protein
MKTQNYRAWNGQIMVDLRAITPLILSYDEPGIFIPDKYITLEGLGLNDYAGVEIFEGDIVERQFERCVVEWNEIGWEPFMGNLDDGSDSIHYKIVGNVYENPDKIP